MDLTVLIFTTICAVLAGIWLYNVLKSNVTRMNVAEARVRELTAAGPTQVTT